MKKMIFLTAILIAFAMQGFGQFSVSVTPGLAFNSARFGYKINNKIVPYAGLQYFKLKYSIEEDPEQGRDFDYEFKGNITIPNIGVKYFFIEKDKLKAFGNLSLMKPMIKGKIDNDGDDEDLGDALEKMQIWGGELSAGVEYFFDDHFSIGGEYGLRQIKARSKYKTERWDYMGDEYDVDVDLKYMISPTFSRISINYYF